MNTAVNRRAALRSLLGAALLPTIKFDFARDPDDLSSLVTEFCDWIDHPRYDLRKPLDDRSHVCHQCGGHGYVARPDCELCHGDERFRDVLDAAFSVPLNARYARLARRIPGAMWLPPTIKDGPVLFRGDVGVVALVMPVLTRVEE